MAGKDQLDVASILISYRKDGSDVGYLEIKPNQSAHEGVTDDQRTAELVASASSVDGLLRGETESITNGGHETKSAHGFPHILDKVAEEATQLGLECGSPVAAAIARVAAPWWPIVVNAGAEAVQQQREDWQPVLFNPLGYHHSVLGAGPEIRDPAKPLNLGWEWKGGWYDKRGTRSGKRWGLLEWKDYWKNTDNMVIPYDKWYGLMFAYPRMPGAQFLIVQDDPDYTEIKDVSARRPIFTTGWGASEMGLWSQIGASIDMTGMTIPRIVGIPIRYVPERRPSNSENAESSPPLAVQLFLGFVVIVIDLCYFWREPGKLRDAFKEFHGRCEKKAGEWAPIFLQLRWRLAQLLSRDWQVGDGADEKFISTFLGPRRLNELLLVDLILAPNNVRRINVRVSRNSDAQTAALEKPPKIWEWDVNVFSWSQLHR